MRKLMILALVFGFVFAFSSYGLCQCTTIQDGTLVDSAGTPIKTGYDTWGYNYEAHMFNGTYCDAYRDAAWCQDYKDIELIMKWNDGWLSNKSCDGDNLLDRHYGYPSYRGSGAWLTNHQSGWVDVDGKRKKWTYFVKIVAVPTDATLNTSDGMYYSSDGVLIGKAIWDDFAIIEEISNDPAAGVHGVLFKSPANPGFGIYGAE
jgi:hypothetical protein